MVLFPGISNGISGGSFLVSLLQQQCARHSIVEAEFTAV